MPHLSNLKIRLGKQKQLQNFKRQTNQTMSDDNSKSQFNQLKQKSLNQIRLNQLNYNTSEKSESKIKYIPNKQYTNKYLRTSSVYQQKQNQKMIHLNRLFTFIRRNQVIQKFRAKRLLNCKTEPNQIIDNPENPNHYLSKNQLRVRVRNNTTLERLVQPPSIKQLRESHQDKKDSKGISFTSNVFQNISPNKKISTSRALQKYARLFKQNIFQSSKSHTFQKSLIPKEKHQHYSSNIETKQMILCPKDLNIGEHKRIPKKYLFRREVTLGELNCQRQQDYNIVGWETTQ